MPEFERTQPTANIVIVDDTPANLHLLAGILKDSGYQVRGFPDGEFALQSIAATPPDLVLLDIRMPHLDGYAVCKHLKANAQTRDIPVIFISALNDIQNKVRGFAGGGIDYITKPFQTEEVLARVQTHLTLRTLQASLRRRNRQLEDEVARRTQAEAELRTLNAQLTAANRQQQDINEQLRLANQYLQEANSTKDKFFAIIAHDLRSPFTALIGLTEAVLDDFTSYSREKLENYLSRIHVSAKQTYALLSNLLAWSRLQRGLMECECERVPLQGMARQILDLFTVAADQKQVRLTTEIPSGLMVYADPKMLHTILRNLISNAVKFTNSGGNVLISGSVSSDDSVDIVVADTGIGMPPEIRENLFRIDARCSRPGTHNEEGTGLGLILCKELVEQHSGSIRVESEVGTGSRFIIALPQKASGC